MRGIKNEKGSALAAVLIVLFVSSVLGAVLWQYSMHDTLHTTRQEKEMRAFYLARAGAEAAMAAWQKDAVLGAGTFESEKIYLNLATGDFQNTLPAKSGGYFTAEIKNMPATVDNPGWTEVYATGVVDGFSRKVTLATHPFTLGHAVVPKWYDDSTGVISDGSYSLENIWHIKVLPESDEITLEDRNTDVNVIYTTVFLSFDKPLTIDLGNDDSSPINKTLNASADVIYFDDLTISYLPSRTFILGGLLPLITVKPERSGSLILTVPDGRGVPGDQVGGDPSKKYGKVVFEGEVNEQRYRWYNVGGLLIGRYEFRPHGSEQAVRDRDNNELEGRAYYFRDGTDLLDIKPQDLIETAKTDRDLKPYFWK